jgi:hypothetical protein
VVQSLGGDRHRDLADTVAHGFHDATKKRMKTSTSEKVDCFFLFASIFRTDQRPRNDGQLKNKASASIKSHGVDAELFSYLTISGPASTIRGDEKSWRLAGLAAVEERLFCLSLCCGGKEESRRKGENGCYLAEID